MYDQGLFNSQAMEFARVSRGFPYFQWSWVGDYLRLFTDDLEVSVVFSFAYSTPALYFRKRFESTPPQLSVDICVPAEHPVTGLPFFTLHSCQSSELLVGDNQLLAWMSAVLPILGLRVPAAMGALLVPSMPLY